MSPVRSNQLQSSLEIRGNGPPRKVVDALLAGFHRMSHAHQSVTNAGKRTIKWFNMRLLFLDCYLPDTLFIVGMILLKSLREMEKLSLIMDMKFFPINLKGMHFSRSLTVDKAEQLITKMNSNWK